MMFYDNNNDVDDVDDGGDDDVECMMCMSKLRPLSSSPSTLAFKTGQSPTKAPH